MEWFLSGVKCAINCEHEKLEIGCNEIISWCWNNAHVLIFCVAVNNFRIILRDSIKGLLFRFVTPDHPVKISPFCQLLLNTFSYVCWNSHRLKNDPWVGLKLVAAITSTYLSKLQLEQASLLKHNSNCYLCNEHLEVKKVLDLGFFYHFIASKLKLIQKIIWPKLWGLFYLGLRQYLL